MELDQKRVYEFHEKYGFARGMAKRWPQMFDEASWNAIGLQRAQLMTEEVGEFILAWGQRDLVKIMDGLGDLAYVTFGSAVAIGADLAPIFREIHESNMSKDVGNYKNIIHPVKGANFKQPRVRELLLAQGFDPRVL